MSIEFRGKRCQTYEDLHTCYFYLVFSQEISKIAAKSSRHVNDMMNSVSCRCGTDGINRFLLCLSDELFPSMIRLLRLHDSHLEGMWTMQERDIFTRSQLKLGSVSVTKRFNPTMAQGSGKELHLSWTSFLIGNTIRYKSRIGKVNYNSLAWVTSW